MSVKVEGTKEGEAKAEENEKRRIFLLDVYVYKRTHTQSPVVSFTVSSASVSFFYQKQDRPVTHFWLAAGFLRVPATSSTFSLAMINRCSSSLSCSLKMKVVVKNELKKMCKKGSDYDYDC